MTIDKSPPEGYEYETAHVLSEIRDKYDSLSKFTKNTLLKKSDQTNKKDTKIIGSNPQKTE